MSEHARDPLEDLRRAWASLEPPPLDDGDDARTRAVVGALQRAWCELPVPAASLPARLRAAPASRPAQPAPWLVRAAAAAVLAGFGALLWRAGGAGPPALSPRRASALDADPVVVVAADAEHLELRSGNVRLILLEPGPAPAASEAEHE